MVDVGGTEVPRAKAEPTQDPEAVHGEWVESPHAMTYVLDEADENSTCARCHAPMQWVPSMDDLPESCTSCKFEVAPPPPVIDRSAWTHVGCKVCHEEKMGEIQGEVLWLEIAAIEEYAEVSSTTALCEKCHLSGDILGHVSLRVEGDHAGFACVDCHDAHTTETSCAAEGCHADVAGPQVEIAGHDYDHGAVRCEACHDAAGLEISPQEATGKWTTFMPARSNLGEGDWRPFMSHNTQRKVDCARCHYAGNPWGLSVNVERES